MTAESITKKLEKKVKFFTDGKGRRTHAVLPIKEYEELVADLEGLAGTVSRRGETSASLAEMKRRPRKKPDSVGKL